MATKQATAKQATAQQATAQQATAQQAEAVVDALMKVFDQPLYDWERPRVMVDTWEHGRTVFVWEEGPYGWMSVFPCGGMLNGTSFEVPEAELPKGVRVEPYYDGCVVSVYQSPQRRKSSKRLNGTANNHSSIDQPGRSHADD
jgi:hypothetical protein